MPIADKEQNPIVSIVMPTYNEVGSIVKLIRGIDKSLAYTKEFIVVDDDSNDGTAQAVSALSRTMPGIRLFVRTKQRNLSSAIMHGIAHSKGQIVVWMDCDLSMPACVVAELVNQIQHHNNDVAVGSRYVNNGLYEQAVRGSVLSWINFHLSQKLNCFLSKMAGVEFNDWTSGFIAVRSAIIKQMNIKGIYGEYFIILMANLISRKYRFIEIPYHYASRQSGESKTTGSVVKYIFNGLYYLWAVWRALKMLRKKSPRFC